MDWPSMVGGVHTVEWRDEEMWESENSNGGLSSRQFSLVEWKWGVSKALLLNGKRGWCPHIELRARMGMDRTADGE